MNGLLGREERELFSTRINSDVIFSKLTVFLFQLGIYIFGVEHLFMNQVYNFGVEHLGLIIRIYIFGVGHLYIHL